MRVRCMDYTAKPAVAYPVRLAARTMQLLCVARASHLLTRRIQRRKGNQVLQQLRDALLEDRACGAHSTVWWPQARRDRQRVLDSTCAIWKILHRPASLKFSEKGA